MIQGVKRFSISSRDNSWFKRLRAAAADHDDEILLEGVKHVRDALHAGWEPIALAATPGRELPAEPPEGVPLLELTAGLFSQLSDTVHAQGVAALFMRPSMSVEKLRLTPRETIVILDAVQDPGNVGTIIRLAAAFDAAAVFLTAGSADPFGPKAIRASAGAVLAVPLIRSDVDEAVSFCANHDFTLLATDMNGEPLTLPLPPRLALAFGNEGQGVGETLLSASKRVAIPMTSRVESLNVAAAAAILLSKVYESR
jgi:TrmH family RNA methyltransferase